MALAMPTPWWTAWDLIVAELVEEAVTCAYDEVGGFAADIEELVAEPRVNVQPEADTFNRHDCFLCNRTGALIGRTLCVLAQTSKTFCDMVNVRWLARLRSQSRRAGRPDATFADGLVVAAMGIHRPSRAAAEIVLRAKSRDDVTWLAIMTRSPLARVAARREDVGMLGIVADALDAKPLTAWLETPTDPWSQFWSANLIVHDRISLAAHFVSTISGCDINEAVFCWCLAELKGNRAHLTNAIFYATRRPFTLMKAAIDVALAEDSTHQDDINIAFQMIIGVPELRFLLTYVTDERIREETLCNLCSPLDSKNTHNTDHRDRKGMACFLLEHGVNPYGTSADSHGQPWEEHDRPQSAVGLAIKQGHASMLAFLLENARMPPERLDGFLYFSLIESRLNCAHVLLVAAAVIGGFEPLEALTALGSQAWNPLQRSDRQWDLRGDTVLAHARRFLNDDNADPLRLRRVAQQVVEDSSSWDVNVIEFLLNIRAPISESAGCRILHGAIKCGSFALLHRLISTNVSDPNSEYKVNVNDLRIRVKKDFRGDLRNQQIGPFAALTLYGKVLCTQGDAMIASLFENSDGHHFCSGSLRMIQTLATLGADIHRRDDEALWFATLFNCRHVVAELIGLGADVSARGGEMLCNAVRSSRDQLEKVTLLLDHGADLHANNDAALRAAVLAYLGDKRSTYDSGTWKVIQLLLYRGADAQVDNNALLLQAVTWNRPDLARALLDYDADVHVNNDTCIIAASTACSLSMVTLLLDRGADARAEGNAPVRGATATRVSLSRRPEQQKVVELLLSHGADQGAAATALPRRPRRR